MKNRKVKKHFCGILFAVSIAFAACFVSCANEDIAEATGTGSGTGSTGTGGGTTTVYRDKDYAAAVIFTPQTDAAGNLSVTLSSATDGAKIYYTTDGTTPSAASTVYADVISVPEDTTIKAIAKKSGIENSPVSVFVYKNKKITIYEYKDSQYPVGAEIKLATGADGAEETYYVVANHLSSINNNFGARTALYESGVSTGDKDVDSFIEIFASQTYAQHFLKEFGITKYIQVWNKSRMTISMNGQDAEVAQNFLILDEKYQKIAEYRQRFNSRYLVKNLIARAYTLNGFSFSSVSSTGKAAMAEVFKNQFVYASDGTTYDYNKLVALNASFEPNRFRITTYPENFGGSASDRQSIEKRYNYDSNGEVALTKANLENIESDKDYQENIADVAGSAANRPSYTYTTSFSSDTLADYQYTLRGNGSFYKFRNKDFTNGSRQLFVILQGTAPFGDSIGANVNKEGTSYQKEIQIKMTANSFEMSENISGTENPEDYTKLLIKISSLSDSIPFTAQTVTVEKTAKDGTKTKLVKSDSTPYTLSEAVSTFLGDYIKFSTETTSLNDYTVPKKIYMRSTYPDSFENTKFLKDLDVFDVTLVPDKDKTSGIYYEEINRTNADDEQNIPDFVEKYSAAFKDIFARTYNTKTNIFASKDTTRDTTEAELAAAITGSTIQIDGTKYYVVSNQLGTSASESSGVYTGDSNVDAFFEKFVNIAPYAKEQLAEVGITRYVQAWNTELITYNGVGSSGDAVVTDRFVIFSNQMKIIAYFDQKFMSSDLIKNLKERQISGFTDVDDNNTARANKFDAVFGTDAEKANHFKTLHTGYEPNRFDIETLPETISDKIRVRKVYKYDSNGEVATTKANLQNVKINKDYQDIAGTTTHSYVYTVSGNRIFHNLGPNEYYFMSTLDNTAGDREIVVNAKGVAPFGDASGENVDNNSDNYRNQVILNFKTSSDMFKITVKTSGNAVTASEKTITIGTLAGGTALTAQTVTTSGIDGLSENPTLAEAVAKLSDNIRFSTETTTLNGYTVPAKIYVRATYPDSFEYCAFMKDLDFFDVTLVPDTSKTEGIFYKEINRTNEDDEQNVPAFVKKYSAAFKSVFARTYNTKSIIFTASE